MAGSLDDNPPRVVSLREFDFILYGSADHGKSLISPIKPIPHADIAACLRRLADWLENL